MGRFLSLLSTQVKFRTVSRKRAATRLFDQVFLDSLSPPAKCCTIPGRSFALPCSSEFSLPKVKPWLGFPHFLSTQVNFGKVCGKRAAARLFG